MSIVKRFFSCFSSSKQKPPQGTNSSEIKGGETQTWKTEDRKHRYTQEELQSKVQNTKSDSQHNQNPNQMKSQKQLPEERRAQEQSQELSNSKKSEFKKEEKADPISSSTEKNIGKKQESQEVEDKEAQPKDNQNENQKEDTQNIKENDREPSNSVTTAKQTKTSIAAPPEIRENKASDSSTSQSQIKGKNHQQSHHTTDPGSLDSTKVSLNSQVTNGVDAQYTEEEKFAQIDKQIQQLLAVNPKMRIQEEEKLIQQYQNQMQNVEKFVISKKWVSEYSKIFEMRTRENKEFKKKIDNSDLVQKDGTLKPTAVLQKDYILLTKTLWYIIYKLYGGGPEIEINVSPDIAKLEFPPYRLENYSNYCYMNACLQSIFSIGELNNYFYEQKYLEYKKNKQVTKKRLKFSVAYYEILKKFESSKQRGTINPNAFKHLSSNNFNPHEQHDAQEYLRYFLGELQDEQNFELPSKRPSEFPDSDSAWKFYFQYNTSIVDKLFCGQLISTVQCQKCDHKSNTYDPFLDLSLPIDSKNLKDLDHCLKNFFKKEQIDGEYKCEKCSKTSRAQKWCRLGKLPKYLVIHLKRFKMFPFKTKIKTNISYDDSLDVSPYMAQKNNESQQYKLIGVIIHSGSPEYGHYVSFNQRSNQWWFCDDDNVQACNMKDSLNQEAYLLFYEKM